MSIITIKSKSRFQNLDIGGQLFLKGKLQFRFIKKWIDRYDADILSVKKIFPEIFTIFKRKQAFRQFKKSLKFKYKRKKNKFNNNKKFIFNFDILDYDLDLEFIKYYTKFKHKNFLQYKIRYDTYSKRTFYYKRLFLKKQRLKIFLNFKDYQFKNIITKLKKNKFYLYDFFYLLEYRLDTILYRIFYFQNFKVVRQYIKAFGVYINKKRIINYNYIVRVGDCVQLSKNLIALKNVLYLMNQLILVPFPKYFEVNYNTLTVIVKSFFLFKNNMLLKTIPFYLTRKNKRRYLPKNKNDINSLYFAVIRKKQNSFIFKKRLYFTILHQSEQLYYPFKFNLEDLHSIFQYY